MVAVIILLVLGKIKIFFLENEGQVHLGGCSPTIRYSPEKSGAAAAIGFSYAKLCNKPSHLNPTLAYAGTALPLVAVVKVSRQQRGRDYRNPLARLLLSK